MESFESRQNQNVNLWLHRLDTERQLRQWPDPVVIAEASMLLGDVALTWSLAHITPQTGWHVFQTSMKQRFGDAEQSILAHIHHCKQREDESVLRGLV